MSVPALDRSAVASRDASTRGWMPIAAIVVAGASVRALSLRGNLGSFDADEAVVGLMARRLMAGDWPGFYWGQTYGGPIEPILTVPLLAVLGNTAIAVKAVPILLGVASAWVLHRIACDVMGRSAALVSTAVFVCFPPTLVWWTTRGRGFYQATILLGLLAVHQCVRLRAGDRVLWRVGAVGLLLGIGFWQSALIGFFVAPCAVLLLDVARRLRPGVRVQAAASFALGCAAGLTPWFLALRRVDVSFTDAVFGPPAQSSTIGDRVELFARDGVPMLFGQRTMFELSWVAGPLIGWVVVASCLGLVTIGAVRLMRRDAIPGSALVAGAVLAPVLYVLNTSAWYLGEGRYLAPMAPFVALLVGSALRNVGAALPSNLGVIGAIGAIGLVSLALLVAQRDYAVYTTTGGVVPLSVDDAISALRETDDVRVADYWLASRIVFETDGEVPVMSYSAFRDLDLQRELVGIPGPRIWLFVDGDRAADAMRCGLERDGVAYESETVRDFVVLSNVPESFGIAQWCESAPAGQVG
jgi:4-amino-4-deoxy-L-arabinose transferase-like glycosyltransferase